MEALSNSIVSQVDYEENSCPICGACSFKPYTEIKSAIKLIPEGLDRAQNVEVNVERCSKCGIYRSVVLNNTASSCRDTKSVSDISTFYAADSICFEASVSKNSYNGESVFSKNELRMLSTQPPATLLDVGCGGGQFLLSARARGYNVTGIDLDPRAVSYVKSCGIEALHCSLEEVPINRKFDIITAFGVLEHIPNPQEFFKEIKLRLKPEGEILIGVPNASSLNKVVSSLSRHNWDMFIEPGHLYHYSAAVLRQLADSAGLEVSQSSTATIVIRGKLPWLPYRHPKLEKFIQNLTNKSLLARKMYIASLKILDFFKVGDILLMSFKNSKYF